MPDEANTVSTPTRTPKTNAEKCRDYRKKKKLVRENSSEKLENSSPEVVSLTTPDEAPTPAEVDASLQRYDGCAQYATMAEAAGMTLSELLQNYVGIDRLLNQDFMAGIEWLCQRRQCHPMEVANAIATKYAPPPMQAPEPAPDPMEMARQQGRLEAEIAAARANPENEYFDFLNQEGTLQAVAAANPQLGVQECYDIAVASHPTTKGLVMFKRPEQPRYRSAPLTPVEKARAASKGVSGAPSVGAASTNEPRYASADESPLDTVKRAMAAQRRS